MTAPRTLPPPASDRRLAQPERLPLLDVQGVEAAYGPYRALFGVSFSVPAGSAVALVGPNGAGKTTVARVISGLLRASAGTIAFDGQEITRWPVWRIARAGLVHAPEGRSVFASLSVEENLVLALKGVNRRAQAEALARAYGAFEHLARRKDQQAGTLSGGEQRMLSLAKVLALPRRLLVVDEVSLGLAPAVVDEVFDAMRQILRAGTSILVVEQHVERAWRWPNGPCCSPTDACCARARPPRSRPRYRGSSRPAPAPSTRARRHLSNPEANPIGPKRSRRG